MLSEKLLDELNQQIMHEFYSAHYYIAMAGYCADQDLPGFENFFIMQAEEERFHAMKFYHYVNEMGARVDIRGLDTPKNNFASMKDVFKEALEHEKFVTDRIYTLMNIATEEKEYATMSMLNWFIDEQIEEMDSMNAILKQLERMGEKGNGIYMLDKELAQRTFTPPAAE
jgi:ferritin